MAMNLYLRSFECLKEHTKATLDHTRYCVQLFPSLLVVINLVLWPVFNPSANNTK